MWVVVRVCGMCQCGFSSSQDCQQLLLGHDLFHYIPILLHFNVFDFLFVQFLCILLSCSSQQCL